MTKEIFKIDTIVSNDMLSLDVMSMVMGGTSAAPCTKFICYDYTVEKPCELEICWTKITCSCFNKCSSNYTCVGKA